MTTPDLLADEANRGYDADLALELMRPNLVVDGRRFYGTPVGRRDLRLAMALHKRLPPSTHPRFRIKWIRFVKTLCDASFPRPWWAPFRPRVARLLLAEPVAVQVAVATWLLGVAEGSATWPCTLDVSALRGALR